MTPTESLAARQLIVAEAMTWMDTPYHHLGDIKGAGVDCAMLLVRTFVDVGILPAFDPRPYSPQWHLHRSDEKYLGWLRQYATETEQPQPGDVGVWRYGRAFSHAGILVEGDGKTGTVVHALRMSRKVGTQRVDEFPLAGRPLIWFALNALAVTGEVA